MNEIVKDEELNDEQNPFWSFTEEEFSKMFERALHRSFIRYTMKRQEKGDSWKDESVTSMEFLRAGLKKEIKEYSDAPIEERFNEICDVINFALMLAEREYEELFESWRKPLITEEKKPWYATRYGERALPDRGGGLLQHWKLDMSPEAVERREKLAKIFSKQMDEDRAREKEMLREFREKKKKEHKADE